MIEKPTLLLFELRHRAARGCCGGEPLEQARPPRVCTLATFGQCVYACLDSGSAGWAERRVEI